MREAISPYQHPNNLGELIQQVCLHPAMFAGSSDFDLAISFIGGYHFAACKFQPEMFSKYELRDFSYWLAEKLGYTLSGVRKVFPSDEAAFSNLPLLYADFINSKAGKSETAA